MALNDVSDTLFQGSIYNNNFVFYSTKKKTPLSDGKGASNYVYEKINYLPDNFQFTISARIFLAIRVCFYSIVLNSFTVVTFE